MVTKPNFELFRPPNGNGGIAGAVGFEEERWRLSGLRLIQNRGAFSWGSPGPKTQKVGPPPGSRDFRDHPNTKSNPYFKPVKL